MIYCVGFACDLAQKNVALIRKKRPTWQEHRLNGIGGKIEFGETPLAGMIREFEEETGIHHEDWVHTVTLFGPSYLVYFFCTHGNLGDLKSITDEKIEIIPLVSLYQQEVVGNLLWLIPLSFDPNVKFPIAIGGT